MDATNKESLQAKMQQGAFSPEDIPDFFAFLAAFGNEDEEMQEEVEDWSGRIQFHVAGVGDFWLGIDGDAFQAHRGVTDAPTVSLSMSGEDAVGIFAGQLDPAEAVGSGALRIEGDVTAALRLQGLVEIAMDHLLQES